MTEAKRTQPDDSSPPIHKAEDLVGIGNQAQIILGSQTYTLRITRAGKLILTK